jgi:hypothetical protein
MLIHRYSTQAVLDDLLTDSFTNTSMKSLAPFFCIENFPQLSGIPGRETHLLFTRATDDGELAEYTPSPTYRTYKSRPYPYITLTLFESKSVLYRILPRRRES